MNALSVKSTNHGQAILVNADDLTLMDDPSQYDGNYTSGGCSPGSTYANVIWDLGSVQLIQELFCVSGAVAGGNGGFNVDFSDDVSSWRHVLTGAANSQPYPINNIGNEARYVRFSGADPGAAIYESRVYLQGGAIVDPPLATGNTAPKTVTGLYNFVAGRPDGSLAGRRQLIDRVRFTAGWANQLTLALEYSQVLTAHSPGTLLSRSFWTQTCCASRHVLRVTWGPGPSSLTSACMMPSPILCTAREPAAYTWQPPCSSTARRGTRARATTEAETGRSARTSLLLITPHLRTNRIIALLPI